MKNNTSKLLAVIIAALMICAIIPAGIFTASANEYTPEELYTYDIWGENATITGITDKFTGGDIVLPATIGGYKVTDFTADAFNNQTSITSITFNTFF